MSNCCIFVILSFVAVAAELSSETCSTGDKCSPGAVAPVEDLVSFVQSRVVVAERHGTKKDQTRQEGHCGVGISFAEFVQTHERTYAADSEEYQARQSLFDRRVQEIRDQNCMPGERTWTAGVNHLSDRTDQELARLRGRKGGGGSTAQPTSGGDHVARERLSTLHRHTTIGKLNAVKEGKKVATVPVDFSWAHLQAMKDIVDQGACGSCWASATTKMLEAHTEIYDTPQKFSLQQMVSCTPNPEECGGNGGCNGSTGELALDYVMHNGLGPDEDLPYSASDVICPASMKAKNANPIPQPASSFLTVDSSVHSPSYEGPAAQFGMVGWNKLPPNEVGPLFAALYQEGPVAVSVVAGAGWNMYQSGVMNACSNKQMEVNHLVVLIGYGAMETDGLLQNYGAQNKKYWQIQNSWGNRWGEAGHIRMIRQDDDAKEQAYCGMDNNPAIGTGCKGGPAQVYVCGSCGVLYDNVVPHFQGSTPRAKEMMKRRKM